MSNKVSENASSSKDTEYVVPQGSILCPQYFNIHLCDLFHSCEDQCIASYVDDTTINTVKGKKKFVINTLETTPLLLFEKFDNDIIKANSDQITFF